MGHTLVTFHAHPDDEALLTAGTMAKAVADGHRVVLVVATAGEVGTVGEGFLGDGEDLGLRRLQELQASADAIGVHRLELLGYADSGSDRVSGRSPIATRSEPKVSGDLEGRQSAGAFAHVDAAEAAERLAALLVEEDADVLTIYDRNGGYGHPDHLKVHEVGGLAAELAGTPVVLEATVSRDLMQVGLQMAASLGYELPDDFNPESFDDWFLPESEITTFVDVSDHLHTKRASMTAHASQATGEPDSTRTLAAFLSLPPEYYAMAFGTEWYVRRDAEVGSRETSVFASLPSDVDN